MIFLRRKIDSFLKGWKDDPNHKPLIVKGARQIGKTASIRSFASKNYSNVIELNFVTDKKFRTIFDDGFDIDDILRNMTFIDPKIKPIPHQTLIFFDEIQECPSCATSLKFFKQDARFDIICSGSLMGLNYKEIESNSVGYKQDYLMHSLDFEEFLWAKGYSESQIDEFRSKMFGVIPYSNLEMSVLMEVFREYITLGGMPEVVRTYIETKNYSGILDIQRQLLQDYSEDITKYAEGFDKARIASVYNHISVFLAKENKKFQVTKIAKNARNREYLGSVEWLAAAGIVNPCYCLSSVELPLKGNYDPSCYKLYFKDTGLLIASLDEQAQEDLRANKNFGTYKGGIYENIVADALSKQGYDLYYYRNEQYSIEMDFFVRDASSLIPVEVKAGNNSSPSLRKLIESEKFSDIHYGIKFYNANTGFNGSFYSFPYFCVCFLRDFLRIRKY